MEKLTKTIFTIFTLFYLVGCGDAPTFNSAKNQIEDQSSSSHTDSPIEENSSSNNENNNKDTHVEINLEEVETTCQKSKHYSTMIPIEFEKPENTCEWGANGNLHKRDLYFQARIEQQKHLNLPAGAIICDASFSFEKQDFLYDDHFLLLFNKSVIASSYNFSSRLEQGVNGLLQYDWNRIAGMYWNPYKETIFCPNIPGAQSDCYFPGHDQKGYIDLSYDPLYIQSIMASGVPQNHSFSIVTLGDNNSKDCEHSDVKFAVMVDYVMPE